MYKLIGVDMDGTLLRKDKTISEKTKKAIEDARKLGVKVVLATGRPVEGIERYLKELDMLKDEDFVVSYNGAVVQETKSKKILSTTSLKGVDYKLLYDVSKELGVNIHAFSEKYGLVAPINSEYTQVEATINGIELTEMPVESTEDNENFIKIMLVDNKENVDNAIKNLPKYLYDKYTVVRSAPYFLEFLDKKANKGEGVRKIAEIMGITRDEVITIGDAGNDLHMIEYAGMGIAMGNAFDEIKEKADYITDTNENDGVAKAIEKFVLI